MSLDGTYDPNNIFAKILRGEAPCFKVFEDDVALAFLDVFPRVRGHTLVAPKVAARTLLDLPPTVVGPYFERVQRVAAGVRAALNPDGVKIMQFNGAPGGQSVFHLHVHILPQKDGVAMLAEGASPMLDAATGKAIAAEIAAKL